MHRSPSPHHRTKELNYDERVLTGYRLYSGLFLGLPYHRLRETAQLLPVFAEHCRRLLPLGLAPCAIVDRFFAEAQIPPDVSSRDLEFLFVQLVERQIVLFDALEEAAFSETHDQEGPGSVAHLTESVVRDSRTEELAQLLGTTSMRIVLTAHPTQFYPKTVQGIISDLREALSASAVADVERLLLQLGKTRFTNPTRPTPVEEAERVLDGVAGVFYEVLPWIVGRAWNAGFGPRPSIDRLSRPPNLQIGFWPGGDRDGNPYVTAEVTERVAHLLKSRILGSYVESVTTLSRRLTFEGAYPSTLRILERLRATEQENVSCELGSNSPTPAYPSAAALLSELLELRVLVEEKHQALFVELVDDLLLRVHLFGFHFASLDLRQHRDVFFQTLCELVNLGEVVLDGCTLSAPDAPAWSVELLEQLILKAEPIRRELNPQLSPLARDTLLTLRLIPLIQLRNGELGLHRVIVSHARSVTDILVVFALAHLAGLAHDTLAVDVIPLFESIEDLDASSLTLRHMFATDSIMAHLARRHHRQPVMVGFSDGTKDGGYLTANLAIREAKRAMTAVARSRGIELVFFDGRGGPPARGGGNTHRFYRSRDLGIDQRHQQLTIQGQTINSHFGSLELARYHLEQLFTANLENLLWPPQGRDPPEAYAELLTSLSEIAHRAYRSLHDDPALIDFLGRHSPLPLFDHLTIGSRPVMRKQSAKLELGPLRAIPFVATWSILKMQVPGFFGLGTALDAILLQGREKELRDLYHDSRFFRTLLDNAAMSLLKSRFDLHAHLAEVPEVGRLVCRIRDEAELSARCILRVSQQPRLLANDSINRKSIEQREQIILPLLVIVQAAYTRYLAHRQAGTDPTPEAEALKKLGIKGIAAIINATRNAA